MRKTRTTTARLHKKIKFNSGNIIQIRSLSWTKIDRKHRTKTRLLNGCALKNVQNNCAPQNQKEKREWRQRETTAVCIRNVTRHLVVTLHFWNNLCWHILANCTAPSQPNGNLVNGHRMKEKIKTIKFIILLLPYTDDSLVVYMLSFFFFSLLLAVNSHLFGRRAQFLMHTEQHNGQKKLLEFRFDNIYFSSTHHFRVLDAFAPCKLFTVKLCSNISLWSFHSLIICISCVKNVVRQSWHAIEAIV